MDLVKRDRSIMVRAKGLVSNSLSRRLPYYLTPDEVHKLIDAADNERDRLFLRTLWETGARISEAIRIRLEDVARDGVRVVGKGNVERVIFVQDGLVSAILFHAQERELSRVGYLFTSRRGGHITKQRADQIIKRAARKARLHRNVHAHLFRHGYAINFFELQWSVGCPPRAAWAQRHQHDKDLPTPQQRRLEARSRQDSILVAVPGLSANSDASPVLVQPHKKLVRFEQHRRRYHDNSFNSYWDIDGP